MAKRVFKDGNTSKTTTKRVANTNVKKILLTWLAIIGFALVTSGIFFAIILNREWSVRQSIFIVNGWVFAMVVIILSAIAIIIHRRNKNSNDKKIKKNDTEKSPRQVAKKILGIVFIILMVYIFWIFTYLMADFMEELSKL